MEKRGESGGLIVWKHLTIESKLLKEKIKEGYKNAKLTTKCFPGVKVLRPKGNPEYNVTQIVICVTYLWKFLKSSNAAMIPIR